MKKLKIRDIRKKVHDMGIPFDKNANRTNLVRAIQVAEGNAPCFATSKVRSCGQDACCWRADCLEAAAC